MVLDAVSNFVRGTADAAIASGDTTISVADASIFPDPATDGEFNVVIWNASNFPRPDQDADVEIVRVTARDTGTNELTVTRAQEMTSAAAHPDGSAIHLSPTAKMFSDIEGTFADFWNADTQELTADVNNTNTTTETLEADGIVDVYDRIIREGDNIEDEFQNHQPGESILIIGQHEISEPLDQKDNSTVKMAAGSTIKWADGTEPGNEEGIFQAIGTESEPLTNVKLIVDGVIDGNKDALGPNADNSVEGIEWEWVRNGEISGVGEVIDCVQDGVDLDNCTNVDVVKLTSINNGGWGFHFGGPGSDRGNFECRYARLTAINNGFDQNRGGLDQNEVSQDNIFVGCVAIDNYKNYEILKTNEGDDGAVLVGCKSIDNGDVVSQDEFAGAVYAQVNGEQKVSDIQIGDKKFISVGDVDVRATFTSNEPEFATTSTTYQSDTDFFQVRLPGISSWINEDADIVAFAGYRAIPGDNETMDIRFIEDSSEVVLLEQTGIDSATSRQTGPVSFDANALAPTGNIRCEIKTSDGSNASTINNPSLFIGVSLQE